jgi:hypothetical protein
MVVGCASTASTSDAGEQADGTSRGSEAAADTAIDSRTIGDEPAEAAADATTLADASVLDAANEADGGQWSSADAAACRTFSNYCGGCTCQALGTGEPNPTCDGGTVTCLLDPCQSHSATSDPSGRCTLH